jgi:sterol desaturase/sphingolipid hydroxylase (fatty acid hydroxylase superfamily)
VPDVFDPGLWRGLADTAFGATSRLFALYILTAAAIAYVVYRLSERPSSKGFWAFLVPPSIYLHPSHLIDIKLFGAGCVLSVLGAFNFSMLSALSATGVMALLSQMLDANGAAFAWSWTGFLGVTILVAVIADFCTYWVHRLHHQIPSLWPFHKVHHSAEVLTPVTVYRKHPVYDFFSGIVEAFPVGALQGLVLFFSLGNIEYVTLGGANIVYVVFNFLGSNLRHSHIWLDFGPALSRLFISPAQHQVHHSRNPVHFNKNYGEMLALWDWMFGTLYIPKERESLEFGLSDRNGTPVPQSHPTFVRAMIDPFRESAAALFRVRRRGPYSPY